MDDPNLFVQTENFYFSKPYRALFYGRISAYRQDLSEKFTDRLTKLIIYRGELR